MTMIYIREAAKPDYEAIISLMKNELGYPDLDDSEAIKRLEYVWFIAVGTFIYQLRYRMSVNSKMHFVLYCLKKRRVISSRES